MLHSSDPARLLIAVVVAATPGWRVFSRDYFAYPAPMSCKADFDE
jgi:hypothetical protein